MKKVFLTLTMLLFAFTGVTRANVQQNRADQVIEQGFEDGLGDWTMNHCHSSSGPTSSYGGNTGNYAFRFYYTTNYPQYLISPELDDNDGVNFTFYAARYSSNYPETFKVGYSSTTNDPTEFTWGSEVTCTTLYGAGAYQEYSYDFPAGTKYVSIACTSNDQFYMFVDDITVTATEPAPAPGGSVEVTIGDPTSTTTNQYLPGYTLYDYAISQQIYTADEIGVAGTINTLTMWLKNSSSYARNINVYMKEVEATEFASATAWESFAAADMVASFTMPNANSTPIEIALPLDNPFVYSGTNNLAICFQDVTGQWSSGLGGVVMDATGNQAIYAYRDGTVYDPSNPGVNGTLLAKKNVIRLSIATGGGAQTALTTTPDVLDLGYRPNGAWMAPYVFTINGTGTTVNALDFSGNYFTYNAELPATLTAAHPLEVTLTTGEAEEGPVNSTMTVLFGGNRDAQQFNVTATAYNPVEGDVYEQAIDVTSFPYNGTAPAEIYKNYELPIATEGADAVYKMTFANDVMLTAGTTGADGVVALYTEDFNGEGGPMEDNNYEYNGPTINPGPVSMWFNYSYTGSNTFFGTSEGGGMIFGYRITPEMLQELGLGNCAITTVEAAAREGSYYDLMILKGGDTPDVNNMVYYQSFEDYTPLYFFDLNLDEPQFLGDDENIWVMFYSDSPYAAYCGKQPVDVNNGKLWYTTNLTSWYSNTTYTPVIYTRFLELPTGREVTVNLADMTIRESKPAAGQIAEAEGLAMGTPKAQLKQNNNRVVVENDNIEDMYVPAGTYYLVAASTEAEFPVSIEVADAPAPEQAVILYPYDGETNVEAPYLAEWVLGDYTEEMQVLVGTQYPPQTALIDWTDYLVESAFITDLEPNQSYFMQVNERNAAGTTYGEIIAFTTPIDPVQGFAVADAELYPGDAAVFTWDAPARSFQGFNIYQDGVKLNEQVITETTYTVEDLAYNMDGYNFTVTAVYDAGESVESDAVTVYMTGYGTVKGRVFDTDENHPIPNATIEFRGTDEYGVEQVIPATCAANGRYNVQVLAGHFTPYLVMEGYAEVSGETQNVAYQGVYTNVNIIAHEYYYPLSQIRATEQEDNTVLVEWSWTPDEMIVDFETGDFSQANFTLPATYPWTVTTTNPYEGTYCMKSTCEGIASGTSSIEVTVDVPYDGKMGFWVRVSSEANYDKFHFYIDGVEKGAAISGQQPYAYKEFDVTEGTHTYKWEYAKDSSVNSNDDCVYVDNITMYRYEEPLPPVVGATVYDFDDETMMGWTSIDADGDGNGWVSSANPGIYHNSGVNLAGTGNNSSQAYVISGSYANQTAQALTPDNYLVCPAQLSAEAGAQIQFWACAQDASYAAEHFGVAVSTTTATAGAFTTIQEWTMTAKGPQGSTADCVRDVRGTRQGTWYQYAVDLSAYAGQDIWVAIRHFNCTDMFILNVDDITLASGGSKVARDDRSLNNYILYRRNNYSGEEVVVNNNIASNVFDYTDATWAAQPFGIYQWGIQAKYDGYAPSKADRDDLINEGFEGGSMPTGWTQEGPGTWSVGTGDYSSSTGAATGTYNAKITHGTSGSVTYLITPAMNLSGATEATISCNYINRSWAGDTDGFGIYYRVNGGEWNELFATSEAHSSWTATGDIALAGMAANYEIGFKFEDHYGYGVGLDDVVITSTGSGPVNPPANGLSEILWSNEIEKDMEATVTFNVTLNNGSSPAGATVAIVGEENTYNGTIDENGTYEVVIRKGLYDMEVALEGYSTWTLSEEITDNTVTYDITLNEIIAPVEDLYVSPTGWAKWKGGSNGSVNPVTPSGNDSFTETFEGGLNGWTVITVNADGGQWIHSDDNLGGYDYTELAHSGTGFAMCYSFVDYVGSFNTDSYLVTPQKYDIVAGSTLSFWADNANDSYPENFSVCVATADNPTANDFTQVWSGGAKGTAGGNDMVRHQSNRYENWRSHEIDLSAYAGQSVYIAFHDVNYDMYEIWIDDVVLSNGSKGDRAPLTYKVKLDGLYEGETVNPYFQHNVEGMEPGSTHVTEVLPIYMTGMPDQWESYEWVYTPCDEYAGVTNYNANVNGTTVNLSWTMPDGTTPPPTPPTPGQGQWYYYDNGVNDNNIGASGPFYWAIMFPAGSYTGDFVTKVATYDSGDAGYAFTGTATIYQGGTSAPGTAVGTVNVATTGATADFIEYEFAEPVAIDATQNLWVVFYNATSSSYCATAYAESGAGDANARWVSLDGSSWMDLATAGISGYGWMLRVYVAEGAKGEVHEITVPTHTCNNAGVLSEAPVTGNRDAWDVVYSFEGTSGYQYGVASDGQNIYTSSWSASSTSMFYKYDLQGNFIEEFNISGCGQLRGMTYDGQYFYGVANSSTVYCVDLANHALVSSFTTTYGAMRCITYDPVRDGFWVVGNWSGNLTLISRTGAILQTAGAPTSASDVAYYKDSNDVEHIYYIKNESGNGEVYEYNITTNTMGTSPIHNCATFSSWTGSSGGCFVGTYDGKTCFFADAQQTPQLIVIYELEAGTTPPVPPVNPEGILGAYVFRDGELVSSVDPSQTTNSFVEEGLEPGEYEYCVRVVYEDYSMSCPVCETVTITTDCDPVTDFAAAYFWNVDEFGAHLTWTRPNDNVVGYDIYVDGLLFEENVAANVTSLDYVMEAGSYEFGIVAKYAYCESEMAVASVEVTSVGENDSHVVIYPNPTNSNVTIEAAGMTHITVVNALGQVVYDADVNADMMQLSLGQYKAGLYMIRINTETGVSVQRVTVVK